MFQTKTIVCLTMLTFCEVNSNRDDRSATDQYLASPYLQEEFGSLNEYLSERDKILSNPYFKGLRTAQSNPFNDQGNFRGVTNIDDDYERDLVEIQRNPFYREFSKITEPTVVIQSARPFFYPRPNVGNVRKSLLPDYDDSCGTLDRQPSVTHLIANADDVIRHYPWLVAIFDATQRTPFICGGTLISKNHMISAAHCFDASRPDDYRFLIANDLRNDQIVRKAKKIQIHSGYLPKKANADIAMVFFNSEVPLGDHIKPICLWTDGYNNIPEITRQDQKGLVVGWGKDENNKISESLPKEAFLPIIEFRDCIVRFNSTFIDALGPQSFCAGYKEGIGACQGDSGSGIIIKRNDRWYLRGVVSLTTFEDINNCKIMEYTAVTDVAKYSHWILSVIQENL